MPKLIAKERFFYAGRNVEAGEEFDAEAQDVELLTHSSSPRAKLVEDVRPSVNVQPMTPTVEPVQPRRRRVYRRRDMRAGD